ncbi:MAG: glycosyltransferase family 2 protein [Alphaproteobacteria bacterium]
MTELRDGVSFVVPVYNKAPYLPRVIEAIRNQAGDFAREYIFVDDGSTDDSLAIVRRLTAGWTDVLIHTQSNHGSAHATNQGIARAGMAFIKFVDADDLLTDRATITLLEGLRGSPACLAFGQRQAYDTAEDLDLAIEAAHPRTHLISHPLKDALRNSFFNPTQILVRTDCAQAVGGCDERITHSQEYSLALRLARCWPFLEVDALITLRPREVPGSLGSSQSRQLRRVTLACAYFLQDHPDIAAGLRRFACRRAAGRAWKYARRHLGSGYGSRWFRLMLQSQLGSLPDPSRFIAACAEAFDAAPAQPSARP